MSLKVPIKSKQWILSLDVDYTLLELWHYNSAMAKFAEISYGIKQKTPEIEYKKQIEMGGIPVPDSRALVHRLMPKSFLDWAFDTFEHVGIYSSATHHYINQLVPMVYPGLLERLDFILDRESCTKYETWTKDITNVAELNKEWGVDRIIYLDDDIHVLPHECNFEPGNHYDELKCRLIAAIRSGSVFNYHNALKANFDSSTRKFDM